MSHEPILIAPIIHEAVAKPADVRLVTPEQMKAADQLFAKEQHEEQFLAGLAGMYTGTMLLRDLAAEHLSHEEEEVEEDVDEPETNG